MLPVADIVVWILVLLVFLGDGAGLAAEHMPPVLIPLAVVHFTAVVVEPLALALVALLFLVARVGTEQRQEQLQRGVVAPLTLEMSTEQTAALVA
jgi:hypothetical protein